MKYNKRSVDKRSVTRNPANKRSVSRRSVIKKKRPAPPIPEKTVIPTSINLAEKHLAQYYVYFNKPPPIRKLNNIVNLNKEAIYKYNPRPNLYRSTLKWGQRKLALTVLEF